MVTRIDRSDVRQQRLRRANVAGRLFTSNMLLTRLQRKPQGRKPARILRNPNNSAGHLALECITSSKISSVRSAITERHTEPLRIPQRNIGSELTWCSQ